MSFLERFEHTRVVAQCFYSFLYVSNEMTRAFHPVLVYFRNYAGTFIMVCQSPTHVQFIAPVSGL